MRSPGTRASAPDWGVSFSTQSPPCSPCCWRALAGTESCTAIHPGPTCVVSRTASSTGSSTRTSSCALASTRVETRGSGAAAGDDGRPAGGGPHDRATGRSSITVRGPRRSVSDARRRHLVPAACAPRDRWRETPAPRPLADGCRARKVCRIVRPGRSRSAASGPWLAPPAKDPEPGTTCRVRQPASAC